MPARPKTHRDMGCEYHYRCKIVVPGEGHQMKSKEMVYLNMTLGGYMFTFNIYLALIAEEPVATM